MFPCELKMIRILFSITIYDQMVKIGHLVITQHGVAVKGFKRHNVNVRNMMNDKQRAVEQTQTLTRRERKAAATRRALFDAGLEAFGRQPIGWVSVVDLTEAVDVAKGVFYIHFKSKDEFLIKLYQDVLGRFLEDVDAALATISTRSTRTGRIRCAAQQYLNFANTSPAATRFLVRMSGYFPDEIGPPKEFVKVIIDYHDRLAAMLNSRAARPPSDAEHRVAAILDGCCWGIIGGALQTGKPLPNEQIILQVAAAAIRCASFSDQSASIAKQ